MQTQQTNISKSDRKQRRERVNSGKADLSTLVYGKIQPQARDLEEAVLGAILIEKFAIDTVVEILKPGMFYVDAHNRIYGACLRLTDRSQPVDILTVVQELKRCEELDSVGGPFAVTKLSNGVTSSANLDAHARIVFEKFIQRELIRVGGEIIADAYEDSNDPFDLLDQVEDELFKITTGHLKSDYASTQALAARIISEAEQRMHNRDFLTGVPTGFAALDRITAGWQAPDLIILAARPSVGKTAFALELARKAAINHLKPTAVAVFSLEMSAGQLMNRLVSRESQVPLDRITQGRMDDLELSRFKSAANTLAQAPIYIDDTAALNIFELRSKARRLVNKHSVGLIIIDYLQLMSGTVEGKQGNREQEISTISRNLKKLAKELNIPIIALSQLSRAVEGRKGNEPQLSDLRESGAIEQDADMVMFLTRPDYQQAAGDVDPALQNLADLHIKKHRNGALDKLAFNTDLRIQAWFEPEQYRDYEGQRNIARGSWRPVPTPTSQQPPKPAAPDDLTDEMPF
ncbi:replicative DNA helicase [Deminuibacter soli]|uniref:Replicative DNA helicase n=1 Tax=Deminuibacter soli TaxID=2291815 RepID=A0A3E1NQ46_9BACT|nr:replicative DNA helicase [Deminuibacter soli]RFM30051.1 replicative DNA helicase [Deminuibacter soli]